MFNKFYSPNKKKFLESMQILIKKIQSDQKVKPMQIEQYLDDAFESIIQETINRLSTRR